MRNKKTINFLLRNRLFNLKQKKIILITISTKRTYYRLKCTAGVITNLLTIVSRGTGRHLDLFFLVTFTTKAVGFS